MGAVRPVGVNAVVGVIAVPAVPERVCVAGLRAGGLFVTLIDALTALNMAPRLVVDVETLLSVSAAAPSLAKVTGTVIAHVPSVSKPEPPKLAPDITMDEVPVTVASRHVLADGVPAEPPLGKFSVKPMAV